MVFRGNIILLFWRNGIISLFFYNFDIFVLVPLGAALLCVLVFKDKTSTF